jgi:hypothetical protein
MKPTDSLPVALPATRKASGKVQAVAKTVLLALFAVATFPPLLPLVRGEGIEWSWQMALNESVARGLVYGRDFTFTYGPLGFVAFPYDMGDMLATAVAWRLILHAFFCVGVGLNVWRCGSVSLGGLLCATIAFGQVRYELTPRILLAESAFLTYSLVAGSYAAALPAAALAAVGLLVKFNTGMAGIATLALWYVVMLASGRVKVVGALPVLAVFLATFLGCFRHYGGPLGALPDFFAASVRVASGYSAQMALPAPAAAMWLVAFPLALIIGAIVAGGFFDRRYAAMGLMLSPVFFNLLKSACVRADQIHLYLYFQALPGFAALFLVLPETALRRWLAAGVCAAVLSIAVYARGSEFSQFAPPEEFPAAAYLPDGPQNVLGILNWTKYRRTIQQLSRWSTTRQRLPDWLLERIGTAPIDAYPQEASTVFANGLNWCPRPVVQSYSAYAPELDEANARHYRAPKGPRFILFELAGLGKEHPWFVDPLTLREIHTQFDVLARGPRFLLLQRRAAPRGPAWPIEPLAVETVRLGDRVLVPKGDQFVLAAALRFRLTAGGTLRDKLCKVYAPSIRLEFEDGSQETYEIAWRNAANGLLVSELPTTLNDLDALWDPAKRRAVTALTLIADAADFDEAVELSWLRSALPAKPAAK